ncbi:tyrosine-protein phosphatase [Rhodococcus jostii]|uniref:tyrosine-protein phosphatase n=1 Tax=Rhodococcus jostii TaxID=132919 RepID=UPI00363F72FE
MIDEHEALPHETVTTDRLANLRDVGGLRLTDGGTTRTGILYRSDAPYSGDSLPEHVAPWPPVAVVDLRSTAERDRAHFEWTQPTVSHHRPLHDAAAPTNRRPPDLTALYLQILDTVPDRVAGLLALVARADGPILVHCAAGKDRTGVVVASLLLGAGVEPSEVIADYLVTAGNMNDLRRRWTARSHAGQPRPVVDEKWLLTPEEAITAVVDRLQGWRTGPDGWLVDHGADRDDLRAWRYRLRA